MLVETREKAFNAYKEIEHYENQTTDWIEDIHESVDEISEVTENIKLDLLKSDGDES